MGLFAVLAADQAARRVVGVGDDVGGPTLLPGTEVHAAQGIVLVLLRHARTARAAQGEVVQLPQGRVAPFQHQRRAGGIAAQVQATLGLPVQDIGLQGDLQAQLGGAEAVQVATAVGVPV